MLTARDGRLYMKRQMKVAIALIPVIAGIAAVACIVAQ